MMDMKIYLMIFVFFVMTLSYIVIFRKVFSLLIQQNWSLSDSLSERPDATTTPPLPPFASSSRLIAFVGMVIIAIIFIGAGYYAIYALFYVPDNWDKNLDAIAKYLMYGGTLFAPYIFNKISTIAK